MKRLITMLCILATVFTLSACSTTCKYEVANGVCGEKVDSGDYCAKHRCNLCENSITSGSSYCDEHRCQFDIGYGRCSKGIGISNLKDGEIYCNTHKSIEDIDEFKEAKDIASTWCNTIAAQSAGTIFSPFRFTDNFYVGVSTYKFEVEDVDSPHRDGYVIVKRNSDGELECEGMEYN